MNARTSRYSIRFGAGSHSEIPRMSVLAILSMPMSLLVVLACVDSAAGFIVPVRQNVSTSRTIEQTSSLDLFTKLSNRSDESQQEYFVRKALMVDMGEAARILTDGFFKDKTNFITYQIERLNTYLSLESTFPNGRDEHAVFVACHATSGKVLAVAEVDNRPRPNNAEAKIRPRPYMCNLAVDEAWRQKGLGRALVTACEEEVSQAWKQSFLSLKVRENNSAAIKMYEKLGYQVIANSVETVESKKKEMLLIMQKKLIPDVSVEATNEAMVQTPFTE